MDYIPLKNELSGLINDAHNEQNRLPIGARNWSTRDALENIMAQVMKLESEQQDSRNAQLLGSKDVYVEVLRFLRRNEKISGIKWVRNVTGWGTKEAKDFVDDISRAAGYITSYHPSRTHLERPDDVPF